jgi:hypothetical protein
LLALGLGGAGAAALAARKFSGVAPNATAVPDDAAVKGAGYQTTDHVKRYYETTKT